VAKAAKIEGFEMGKSLPKKIGRSPLIASTAEIRFREEIPPAILLGRFYGALGERYAQLDVLPSAHIPPELAKQNPQFAYVPHHRLKGPDSRYTIQMGPRVLTFSAEPHLLVDDLSGEWLKILQIAEELDLLVKADRIGLRYINLFEGRETIASELDLTLIVGGELLTPHLSNLRVEIPRGRFRVGTVLGMNATVQKQRGDSALNPVFSSSDTEIEKHVGCLLDLDVFTQEPPCSEKEKRAERFSEYFLEAHTLAKETFFGILKDDIIRQLDPEY